MEPSTRTANEQVTAGFPDHTQLPDEDGTFVHNFQEHPQSNLLTSSLLPRLQELHPMPVLHRPRLRIYYHHTQPPLDGCKAPTGSTSPAFRPC
jgi:hypothetical protein